MGVMRSVVIGAVFTFGVAGSAHGQADQAQPVVPIQAPAPSAAAAQPANIPSSTLLTLTRMVLLALDQANKTGNYSVLRDMGAPDFILANSPTHLADVFASQRSQHLDLSNAAVLEPQLTLQPQIEPNGMLRFAGFYAAGSGQLKFELLFQPIDQQWRLYGLAVNLAQAGAGPAPAPASAGLAVAAPAPTQPAARPKPHRKPSPTQPAKPQP